jgi:hypothetical protein
LFVVQLRGIARRLEVDQPVRALGIGTFNPIADDLPPHATDLRRLRSTTAIVNNGQCQKTTRLIGVPDCSSQTLQVIRTVVLPKRKRCSHSNLHAVLDIDSQIKRFGNPKNGPASLNVGMI